MGEGEEGVEEGGKVDVRAWPDAGGREDSSMRIVVVAHI